MIFYSNLFEVMKKSFSKSYEQNHENEHLKVHVLIFKFQ